MSSLETRQLRFGYKEQSTFDTPEVDGSAVNEVTVEPFDLDPDVMVHDMPQDHGSRSPVEQNTVHSILGSTAKFSVKCPVDLNDIDHYLYSHFHSVVEAAGSPYLKTFKYFTTHPSFANDEGHFLTWWKRLPTASVSQKAGGCIANRIKLSAERDKIVQFESDWLSHGSPIDNSNPFGVWTPRDGSNLLYFNDLTAVSIIYGDNPSPSPDPSPVSATIHSFEIECNYDVTKLGHNAVQGYTDFGFSGRSGNFKLKLLRDVASDTAFAALKAGTICQISFAFGSTMTIDFSGKIEKIDYDAEGLLIDNITGRLFSTHTADQWGELIQITVANDIDRSW
jgi:hypothetical protein